MWRLGLVIVCACGRIGFDPVQDSPIDALPHCFVWGAFSSPPVHIVELGSPGTDDWGPALSADALTIYWYTQRPGSIGSFDIWTSTRASRTSTWNVPTNITEINTAFEERVPWISYDGLTLGFASDRGGGPGGYDLWWATRPTLADPFAPPELIPNVNSPTDELGSYLSASGLRLYISTTRGTGGLDIYVAERPTVHDPFGTPTPVAELNSPTNERDVAVSADELEAFIVSIRAGSQGDDIYRSTRPDLGSPFSVPVRVDALDTPMDDTGPELSRDGTEMYFNYNAVSSGGDAEIWVASRTCLQ